ncbi:hypothetical protein HII31_05373, partial [Pseudocercospora fuligena]
HTTKQTFATMSETNPEPSQTSQDVIAESSSCSQPSKSPSCANCNKLEDSPDPEETPNLKPCISCKSVLYCSRDCKKAHTKQHKKVCASLAQEYSKTADIKMAKPSAPKMSGKGGKIGKWEYDT